MIGILQGIEIGNWYRIASGDSFEVVALDLDSETVEIQYYDGAVEELDFDSWLELSARPAVAPNDAAGALDLIQGDYSDGGIDFDNVHPVDRFSPLEQLDWH
jgi:hypothetical protein